LSFENHSDTTEGFGVVSIGSQDLGKAASGLSDLGGSQQGQAERNEGIGVVGGEEQRLSVARRWFIANPAGSKGPAHLHPGVWVVWTVLQGRGRAGEVVCLHVYVSDKCEQS
jgi:hypothetical protein